MAQVAVCSQINTKHINAVRAERTIVNIKLLVLQVTGRIWKVNIKFPLFLSDFSEIWISWPDFPTILKYKIPYKSVQWSPVVLRGLTYRQTDRQSLLATLRTRITVYDWQSCSSFVRPRSAQLAQISTFCHSTLSLGRPAETQHSAVSERTARRVPRKRNAIWTHAFATV